MPSRIAIALVAAAALAAGAGTAGAAPRKKPAPLCSLVTDAKADVATGNQSLDIVSADIASNAKTITAVIRVAKLTEQDLMSPTGRYYEFAFTYEGAGHALKALITPTGTIWADGKGSGVFDLKKNEIRISKPVDDLTGRPVLKPGVLLTGLLARADVGNPAIAQAPTLALPMSLVYAGDKAPGTKNYPVHAASCVRVGA